MRGSTCTSCSISEDRSAYWVPELYYQNLDGTFTLVPNAGLTVYYLSRSGSGAQAHPNYRAFSPGLRMLSGTPGRRSFNASSIADQAISYACIGVSGPQTNQFPADATKCSMGLRAQVFFSLCVGMV